MKPFLTALLWAITVAFVGYSVDEHTKNEPIRCASPIDPELHIVVKDGQLDTTWVYVRNNN
jgi:hypothetical protein